MAYDPNKFKSASPILINYNYTDISDGTGIQVLYGATTQQDATKTYVLSKESVYSNDITTTDTISSGTFTKELDLDFDLSTFNISKRIKGTAVITASMKVTASGATSYAYYLARIKKNDTTIATGQSQTIGATAGTNYETMTTKIELPTTTNFEKGDVLRVTVEVWANTTSTGSIWIAHDPMDRTYESMETTQLKVNIPFDLEL